MTANDALAAAAPAAPFGGLPVPATAQSQEPRDRDASDFVEAALAAAPGDPVPPSGPLPGTAGFAAVLAPFAELAGRRLLAGLGTGVGRSAELDRIVREFTADTAAVLGNLAARALVLELQATRVEGRLVGATPQARFRDFVANTGTRAGLVRLFTGYPLLAQLVGRGCVNAVAATAELLNRYAEDRAEMVARLLAGRDPGPLVAVDRTAGDTHRRGRRVAVLRFADGSRVVHKPRSLAADRHFGELVDWCSARTGTALRTPALLTRPNHGWSELIEARPCASRAELDQFYLRQGVLLALAHVLDLTDLHHENLIACADQPVLVDVETLFHPPLPEEPAADDPAGRALDASVQRIGLLPQLVLGDEDALDLSGLGGGADRRSPVETACWEAAGTDAMRLVRRPGAVRASANRPRLADGAQAEPAAHTEALVAGFHAGYRTFLTHRRELAGLLRRFADDEVRVVTRATQVYATVLAEATHPDVLREPADREELLRLLGTDAVDDRGWPGLLDHEVAELWDGDVPVFTARPGRTDLWSGTGTRIPGALDRPGLERVTARLAAMDEAELAVQERIIRTALACRTAAPVHPRAVPAPRSAGTGARAAGPAEAPAPTRLLAAAQEVGDALVRQAHRSRDRVNWLGVELLGERYRRLAPCGADLGHGYPGVALFLAHLAALTGADRYAGTARAALRPLPRLLDRLAALPDADLGVVGSGGFTGLGGILYALTRVSAVLDDAGLRALVEPVAELTVRAAGTERPAGVLDGTAGGLAALLAAHRARPSAGLLRGAEACAERVAAAPVPAEPGFATGAAGIGWALLGFADAGGGEQYRRAGLAALRPAVAAPPPAGGDLSWCTGATGVALAVADRPAAMAEPAQAAAVAATLDHLADSGPVPDGSLCHGEWGLLELPHRTAADVVLRARTAGPVRPGPQPAAGGCITTPGLLTGLAGHGLGLLRLGFADLVPSALLLRTPDPEPVPPRLRAAAAHGCAPRPAGPRTT
ncbi:type 2 lanthipeptide synthetase LanM family protein [Streptomyces seoulensis]|uniref:type 2 lanthipeptide synthetase LanM family protein n=2 Tax=Streptomyces seoulensis TaxID=73044 RepID=UPI003C2DA6C2